MRASILVITLVGTLETSFDETSNMKKVQFYWRIVVCISVVIMFVNIIPWMIKSDEKMEFLYFEAEIHDDFPTVENASPIPHILHQTYKSEIIPEAYVPQINSFLKYHPNWTYYFWSETSARKLIAHKFPYFLNVWDGYKHPINRADALRYFVLYEYGGVYADCDMRFLRSLDNATKAFAAIIPPEPFEHSVFRLKMPLLTNNAIMLSRPKHPFFKLLIDRLEATKDESGLLEVAGPVFLQEGFLVYNNIQKKDLYTFQNHSYINGLVPYNLQGKFKYPLHHQDNVLVPNTHFFMNTLAWKFKTNEVLEFCKDIYKNKVFSFFWFSKCIIRDMATICPFEFFQSRDMWKRGCNEIVRREGRSKKDHSRFTFTEHMWHTSYEKVKRADFDNWVDIKTVVPKAVIYN
ncbi:uncharacterized protein LOC128229704 [Mya arenaria]|uniref:uncharacterized protein LOC128229704 n=1 Tax=Mya arenaria TaxID=6604 RepID=UPI0022DF14F5|nr:uncharacterized protein LOC128229704 [Mya arenaria]